MKPKIGKISDKRQLAVGGQQSAFIKIIGLKAESFLII